LSPCRTLRRHERREATWNGNGPQAPWYETVRRTRSRQRSTGRHRTTSWCSSSEHPTPLRRETSCRRLQLPQPVGEVTPPYPELPVGQLERSGALPQLAPPVERPARNTAQLIQDLANSHQLIATVVHVGSPSVPGAGSRVSASQASASVRPVPA